MFVRSVEEGSELWVVDADGRRPRRLIEGGNPKNPEWSPDGRWILFELEGNLAVVSPMGGRPQLVRWIASSSGAAWSPDGRSIAFVAWDDEIGNDEVFTAPFVGGRARRLTQGDGDSAEYLDWSPDGRLVAFGRGDLDDFDAGVYIVGANGVGELRLALPTPATQPSWQPRLR